MTYPHIATISRSSLSGGKYIYANVATGQKCFLQPLDATESQVVGLEFGKGFNCYMPQTTDIAKSDRIIIDNTTYGVRSVMNRNYGSLAHKQVILELV